MIYECGKNFKNLLDVKYHFVISFKKHSVYKEQTTYWMHKVKEKNTVITELYKHPNYIIT